MLEALWFSFNITAMQLSGVYFRYLPFRADMSYLQVEDFWRRIFIWSSINFSIIATLLYHFGVTVPLFKAIILLGWIPYIIISVVTIREKISLHIFIIGIQALWSLMIHTIVAITIKLFWIEIPLEAMFFQGIWYVATVLLLIRFEIEIFTNVLNFSKELFKGPLNKYITIMPLAIFVGCVLPVVTAENYTTFKEQFLRFLIPIFCFFMYRAVKISNKQFEELQNNSAISNILNHQLETLKLYETLMQDNQRQIENFRRDLRESYIQISKMLDNGKKEDALNFIYEKINLLQEQNNHFASSIPLLNAVFLIYRQKAEEFKINFNQKIMLTKKFSVDEMDLAVLLANLLEQVFESVKNAPENLREVYINIHNFGYQIALEISAVSKETPFKDKTLAENFAEKYAATLKISQEKNSSKIYISWQEKAAPVVSSLNFSA